ncbi:MAG TPA: beta-propeller fold lactonase family protein, partial [Candidatus Dormibacteraeota bacterium]
AHAVFVQTNDLEGNAIAAYHRNSDGTLSYTRSYRTGGLGGRAAGSASDPLASQGSLRLLPEAGLLLAVNAGSDTISVFHVDGDRLELEQVLPSGGPFPVGFAVHGDLVYVLDGGGQGYVSGYRIEDGTLRPIAGSTRTLLLANTSPPFFLGSPAQAGFTPDGLHLIVTTKTHNTLDVFSVGEAGRLSAAPVANAEAPVPFAFVFDPAGHLVLNFAGSSSLETFTVNADNTVTPVGAPVSDGQAAACWVTKAAGFEYAANTGSNDVSQFRVAPDGTVTLVNPIAASNIPGATDLAAAGGSFLYVDSSLSSSVHAFAIGAGGSLTPIQIAAVPDGDDLEGIAVS